MSSLERDSLHRVGRNRNGGAAVRPLGSKRDIRCVDLCAVLNSVKRTLRVREAGISKSNVNRRIPGRGGVDDQKGILGRGVKRGRGQSATPRRGGNALGHVAAALKAQIRRRGQQLERVIL